MGFFGFFFWVGWLAFFFPGSEGGKLNWSYNVNIKYSVGFMNETHKIRMNVKSVFISQDNFCNLGWLSNC